MRSANLMDRKPPKNARHLLHTLHVAAAQILFLDIPDSAAVNLAVTSLKNDQRSTRFASLGNAVLRRMTREKNTLLAKDSIDERARLNMPQWLFRDLRKGYGREKAQAIAGMHMHEPVIDLTVKNDPAEWAEKLGGIPLFGNSIRVPTSGSIADWPGYEDGAWWVQDAAASLPTTLLGDIAGKRVADLCAAPGGKTAQLAAAGAKVTAVENSAPRLERLKSNLDRLKLQAECIEADLLEWEPEKPFDAILLDAPCSSTGTIRRHPDVQWTKSPEIVAELAALQKKMLLRTSACLKPGGTLVFANCSINREEGEDIVAKPRIQNNLAGLTLDPVIGRRTARLRQTASPARAQCGLCRFIWIPSMSHAGSDHRSGTDAGPRRILCRAISQDVTAKIQRIRWSRHAFAFMLTNHEAERL